MTLCEMYKDQLSLQVPLDLTVCFAGAMDAARALGKQQHYAALDQVCSHRGLDCAQLESVAEHACCLAFVCLQSASVSSCH